MINLPENEALVVIKRHSITPSFKKVKGVYKGLENGFVTIQTSVAYHRFSLDSLISLEVVSKESFLEVSLEKTVLGKAFLGKDLSPEKELFFKPCDRCEKDATKEVECMAGCLHQECSDCASLTEKKSSPNVFF